MTNEAGATGQGGGDLTPPPVPPVPPQAQPPAPGYTPPPPAAGYAPPPAPGYAPPPATSGGSNPLGFDPKSLQNFDPKTVNPLDWAVIGAGVLIFIFSFISFYVVKAKGLGISVHSSESGWHGFFGFIALLLAIVASALLAADLIAKVKLPFPVRLSVLGGYAVSALFLLIAFFVHPGTGEAVSGPGYSVKVGHGFGYWVCLLIALVATGLSFVRFTQTGGKLPKRG